MMKDTIKRLTYEIELQAGETLTLPPSLVHAVGAGRWMITVEPAEDDNTSIRCHAAFLNGYDAADEGLYDDLASR